MARVLHSPLALALVVTLANAAKPVLIDDTAYLTYARHIAAQPLDPYGFDIFWYEAPQPAFTVLCPPVVPYWLAAGIALFGEPPARLKLWMFPFVWALAWAVRDLLRRFAGDSGLRFLPLLVLSPAVLPTVNLMLDVPAVGLGLAVVALFARAADANSWRLTVASGLVAALATQTKYTALLVPPAVVWYGLTHRRVGLALVASLVAVAGFAIWESLIAAKYGRSHFEYHATEQRPLQQEGESATRAFLREKSSLVAPLVGHLGCLGIGVSLVACAAVGVPRRVCVAIAVVWTVGFLLVLLLPYRYTVLVRGQPPDGLDVRASTTFWLASGVLFLSALAGCAVLLTLRFGKGLGVRVNADAAFLVGWVLLELVGYFALTPFGAARRVIGLVLVGGLLAARAASRAERVRPHRRLPTSLVGFGVAAGFAVAALDTFDAFPEKACAERAAVVSADRPAGAVVWYAGHWGFQYYCERAGMVPLVPGKSELLPGDVLVLPAYPNTAGLHRPHVGVWIDPPPGVVEVIAVVASDDWVSGRTVPTFYSGVEPILGRDHPRLRVVVYRVVQPWVWGKRADGGWWQRPTEAN